MYFFLLVFGVGKINGPGQLPLVKISGVGGGQDKPGQLAPQANRGSLAPRRQAVQGAR